MLSYKPIIKFLILLVLFFSVVLPNAYKVFVIGIIIAVILPVLLKVRISDGLKKLLFFYMASVIVTLFYLCIGILNNIPYEAVIQTVIIYIISPLIWMIILTYFIQNFSDKKIIKTLNILTLFACVSVALYFYLFLNYGEASIAFFGSNANVNMNDEGYSGAIMHVFGSLVFLGGGYFINPNVVVQKSMRYLILTSIFLVIIFAGRTALMLAVFLSLFLYIFSQIFKAIVKGDSPIKVLVAFIFTIFLGGVIIELIHKYIGVDFYFIVNYYLDKILAGGGGERSAQASSLLEGVANSNLLGAGHGMGVEHIRSYEFPWRYELVWLSTLYKTGFLGSTVYISVFIFYFYIILARLKSGTLRPLDKFFSGGLLGALIASNTNPYIEAFSFQWMFIMPLVYLFNDTTSNSYEKV